MTLPLHGISSMATRQVLAELAQAYERRSGRAVTFEAVGGVDAARRVQAGESFDWVALAADAIDRLTASGRLQPHSRVDLMRSPVALAVRAGAPRPDVSSESALRQAVLAARSLCTSTGPSGTYVTRLFESWGVAEQIQGRLVTAPPGVPVATLVARGEVELAEELQAGFGFFHGKPSSAFAPFAVTPDELGDNWNNGRIELPLNVELNGEFFGKANGKEMHFNFGQLIAHAARTRNLMPGTIIGSGTVSNDSTEVGSSCLLERRMIEKINDGAFKTPFMKVGDTVKISMNDATGNDLFGTIEQTVVQA